MSFGAVSQSAGMEKRAPFVAKTVTLGGASYSLRMLDPISMMPLFFTCSGDWDRQEVPTVLSNGASAVSLRRQANPTPFNPGTFPAWYKAEIAKGNAVVIDVKPQAMSWCAGFQDTPAAPAATSANAYATTDIAAVQLLLAKNPQAFLVNADGVKWWASAPPIAVAAMAPSFWNPGTKLALGVIAIGLIGWSFYVHHTGRDMTRNPLRGGGRFDSLVRKLKRRRGVRDPKALAAWIERRAGRL